MLRPLSLLALLAVFSTSVSAQPLTVTTLAGPQNSPGWYDGTGSDSRFSTPRGVAVDSNGNVLVADWANRTIRMTTPAGTVTTLAGLAGSYGSADGTGSAARFGGLTGIALDSSGNVYVADSNNHTIRKVTPAGVVSTLAGLAGSSGSADGSGNAARFHSPADVAVDNSGNVYVADFGNNTIRVITPTGVVTTLAGMAGTWGSTDGTGNSARFYGPQGVAVGIGGNVYVADTLNHTIRMIGPTGVVTTLAGLAGTWGSTDGTGSAALFREPRGMDVDSSGNVYVAGRGNHVVRVVTPAGVVTTLAGMAGSIGFADGAGSAARFHSLDDVAVDNSGNVFVADRGNHLIRMITPAGVVTTLAGFADSDGSVDGTGSAARFKQPRGMGVNSSGNIYVADTNNHTIRMITPAGVVTTLAGLAGSDGSTDGTGSAARFFGPWGVAVDSSDNVYVADTFNHTIRMITPAGVVTTVAGLAGSSGSDDGTGGAARFNQPFGVAVDGHGNIYVADRTNHTIRMITPAGVVTTLAGSAGTAGWTDATGSSARFRRPNGVGVDSSGNVYVADTGNHTIRMITPSGVVTTLAGLAGSSGSANGTGSAARFSSPANVTVNSVGLVYVADSGNNMIRRVSQNGAVTTLAGFSLGNADGTGSNARLLGIFGVGVDSSGYVYVTDTVNHNIRKCVASTLDVATIDLAAGFITQMRQLDTSPQTASSWEWSVVRRPSGSTAALSETSVRNPTFTPDAAGLYTFRMFAENSSGTSISYVTLDASVPLPELEVARSGGGAIGNGGTNNIAGTVNGTMSTANYDLENVGSATLTFGTPSVTATPGTGNPTVNLVGIPAGGSTLAINGTTDFTVQVTPNVIGPWTATLQIHSDGTAGGTHTITLSGTAQAAPAPLIGVLRNGNPITNGGTDTLPANTLNLTYTIHNNGSLDLDLTGTPIVANSGEANCTVTVTQPGSAVVVANGGTVTFTVEVTANSTGNFSFELSIPNSDATATPYEFTVEGSTTAPSSGGGGNGSGGSGCSVGTGTSPLLLILVAMLAAATTAHRRRRALAGR